MKENGPGSKGQQMDDWDRQREQEEEASSETEGETQRLWIYFLMGVLGEDCQQPLTQTATRTVNEHRRAGSEH